MMGFPLDSRMTYTTDPKTGVITPSYDRAVTSKPLRHYIRGVITSGVIPNPSDNLQVFAGGDGMTVVVHAGFAIVDGGFALEESSRTLEVTAADTTYDRIDTVVVRWNDNESVRNVDLHIVQGTPARNPVRPTLTREGSIYELGLADIFVTKNVATITDEKITDTRLESERCGVASAVAEWDTTTIYRQIQADLAGFKTNEQAEFLAWFDRMKDQLSEDAAGHLQSEIDVVNVAISGLDSTKQNKEDNTLDTTSKTIVGAINEHEADIANCVTTAGTALTKNDKTLNHANYGSAGTAGTSSATSGSTIGIPYITTNAQGHVTGKGTHTHTVTGFLSTSGGTVNGNVTANVISGSTIKTRGEVFSSGGTGLQLTTESDSKPVYIRGSEAYVMKTSSLTWANIAANAFTTMSSKLVKENISDLPNDEAEKVLKLNPVKFDYKENFGGKDKVGLIAEDALEVIPQIVIIPDGYDENDFDESKGILNRVLTIDYSKVTPYLIKLCQIQQKQIDELEKRVKALENR